MDRVVMGSSATCGVYEVWCGPHFYQGSSKNIPARLRSHRKSLAAGRHGNTKFQRAFDKYGWTDSCVLVECSEESRFGYEQDYIDANWGDPNFLNITPSSRGPVWTDEMRAKVSATLKGRPANNKGKPATEQARANMSEAHKLRYAEGRGHSEEAIEKMRAAAIGNTRTKGAKLTSEHIEKIASTHRGRKRSPEARANMAEAQRKRWARAREQE